MDDTLEEVVVRGNIDIEATGSNLSLEVCTL